MAFQALSTLSVYIWQHCGYHCYKAFNTLFGGCRIAFTLDSVRFTLDCVSRPLTNTYRENRDSVHHSCKTGRSLCLIPPLTVSQGISQYSMFLLASIQSSAFFSLHTPFQHVRPLIIISPNR